jgi:LPXTG-site transpeptidase (sortase) family protein
MPRHARRRPNRAALVAGGVGELMLTAGAVVLLFVVYTLWGTGIQTANAQDELRDELGVAAPGAPDPGGELTKEPPSPEGLDLGDAYGLLRIPRFGADWEWVVVEGVEPDDLENGPGHYPESADAGQIGNFAVAAHRSGHGWPFAPFPELRVGDRIEIVTAQGTFFYELDDAPGGHPDGNKIEVDERWVVAPVPGQPSGTEPTERRITLTTCWPEIGSSHRMYATGVLVAGPEL